MYSIVLKKVGCAVAYCVLATSKLTLFCTSSWENKDLYAQAVRALRLRELQNVARMSVVRAGLGSIIPLQLLTMFSPLEMELRTCGLPFINLEFLKVILLLSMLINQNSILYNFGIGILAWITFSNKFLSYVSLNKWLIYLNHWMHVHRKKSFLNSFLTQL